MHEKANKLFEELKRKYKHSKAIYISLNVFIYVLSAAIVVLNVYTIRLNTMKWHLKEFGWDGANNLQPEYKGAFKVMLYFVLSISFAAGATIFSSILSAFKYKQIIKDSDKKIKSIQKLQDEYNSFTEPFANNETRDLLFAEQVTEIINKPMKS